MKEIPPVLYSIAKDKEEAEALRSGAIKALGAAGTREAVSALLAIARDEKDVEDAREAAVKALAFTGKGAVPLLARIMKESKEGTRLRDRASVELSQLDRAAWRKAEAAARQK
jgi:HEAT repeat protein